MVAGVYTTRCRCLNDLGFQSLISKVARVPLRWGSGACGVTRWRKWAGMFPSACDRGLGACCLFGACYLWWRMTWCDGSGACLCPNDAFPAPRYLTPPGSLPGGGGACMDRQLAVGRGDGCAHLGHLLWRTGAWIWCHLCGMHSLHKVRGLGRPCRKQVANRQAALHRDRLRDGLHLYSQRSLGAVAVPLRLCYFPV